MKNKNLFLYLLFFLFIIIGSLLSILIFFLWRDIAKVESKLQLVNETVTLDNDYLFKKKVDNLGAVTSEIMNEQDRIFEQITDRYYQINSRIDDISNRLTLNINNLTSDKVTTESLNSLNETFHSMMDDLLFLSNYYANRTDYIERYVHNNSKALVEHLGYSLTNVPSLPGLYPSQNESCGQCTFVIDHDSTSNITYTIKPFLYTNINNSYLSPLLDLNEADILINGTETLKDIILELKNNDINITGVNNMILYNQEIINSTIEFNKQLLIQLIYSNQNLTAVVQDSVQFTSTQSSIETTLHHIDYPYLAASFLNSNYTPFLTMDSFCNTIMTSVSGTSYSYKTSIFCLLSFSINNNTDYADFQLYSLGPITINIINSSDIPSDYTFPVNSLRSSSLYLYSENPAQLSITDADIAFRYKTPLDCLIQFQPLAVSMQEYQMKIFLPSNSINPAPLVFSHQEFDNNFQYTVDYSFYS